MLPTRIARQRQLGASHPPPPADVIEDNLPETMTESGLLNSDDLASMALGIYGTWRCSAFSLASM